jgi:hypothetical protein
VASRRGKRRSYNVLVEKRKEDLRWEVRRKAIFIQGWTKPWVSRRSRLSDFNTIDTVKVLGLLAPRNDRL